ncbi:hypothetical protein RAS12_24620 [Achromobacter seleniivolatilans]|uniref:Glycosyltransferase RgtA/B/C/D-like domain-containing protein n=1 Tax=Achromobacter seleniivolatilans TaxID=3047478 RepID=A0ABY9LZ74_9BURK|nr:hypothetical protein [Achromobacter sp. R39]WMD19767.1 hypothetical protein RAS12_24620 [Achromobacter sp. R39]
MKRFFTGAGAAAGLLCLFYIVIAAAAFNGFYTKWRLNDAHEPHSLSSMVDGSAYRPYVYRQFVPDIANRIQDLLPQATVDRLSQRLADPDRVNSRSGLALRYPASQAMLPEFTLRYHLVYYLTFLGLLASLFVMRRLCLRLGASAPAATVAPAVLALLLPFFLTEGGFFYDFFEVLFMAAAICLAWLPGGQPARNMALRLGVLVLIAAMGAWNKEAFLFFVLTLYPLLRQGLPRLQSAAVVGVLALVCGCVYVVLRARYAGNPGGTVSFQPFANLIYHLTPENWFRTESTYGITLPKGLSAVMVLMIAGVSALGWKRLPAAFRLHVWMALAVNVPLYLLFAAAGEARNLSLLYPALLGVVAMALTGWLNDCARGDAAAPG